MKSCYCVNTRNAIQYSRISSSLAKTTRRIQRQAIYDFSALEANIVNISNWRRTTVFGYCIPS